MVDAESWDPYRLGEWNPYYCPKGLRLWLSASLCAGNVQQGLLKTKLREGSMICWKDARKLVEAQGLDMDDQLRTLLGDEAEDFGVRFLYSSCDSSLQPLSEPLQLNAIWLDGDGPDVRGECESWFFDAGSWRPRCLVITNAHSDSWFSHTEFVSGLEALCLYMIHQTAGCRHAFQRLRVLHLKNMDGARALDFLGSMPSLETLILSYSNDSTDFPAVIRKLSSLRKLYIEDLLKPCNWLRELVRLEKLRIECRNLVLPSSVGALTSLRAVSLLCFERANSLELTSNLQSLEKLSLRMYGGTTLPFAITALARLTTLKLLGSCKYKLPKEFNIRCFPRLELLRLSGYLFESLDKTRLPEMEEVKVPRWSGWGDIYEAKAPFSWAGASQSMHPTGVNHAELGISLEQHSRDMRGVAGTDVEAAALMEAVNEGGSDADPGLEQIGGAMSVAADGLVLLRPRLSHRLMPPPLSTNLGRQATLEQDPEPLPEPALYVDRAHEISPEGAVHAEAVDEVRLHTDVEPEQIRPTMAVPARSVVRFAVQPLVAASITLQQHEPSGTAAGGRRSTKGQELCCMKCTHMNQTPVPLKKHVCLLKDKKWEDIERETGRSSYDLKKRGRQAALEQAPEPLPEPTPNVQRTREIISPDNKMVVKMRTVVSAMERLGDFPKMLEDMSKKFEPKDLERISIKMEDRYDALREELSGLCQLLGTDIKTMLRAKD